MLTLKPLQLTIKQEEYLEERGLKSRSQGRGNKIGAQIDGIGCKLARANTLTENLTRLLFDTDKISRAPFTLFRGVSLQESDIEAMLEAKSTLTFLCSNNSSTSCYAPIAKMDAVALPCKNQKSVVFIIPPNLISLKNDWVNIGCNAFLLEDLECRNVPISKSWELKNQLKPWDNIYYIQLADTPINSNLTKDIIMRVLNIDS